MFSSSRYLATVRREMGQPSSAMASHSFWSDMGCSLSSRSASRLSSALAAATPTSPPPVWAVSSSKSM